MKIYKYKDLEFFANNGLITMIHKNPNGEEHVKTETLSTLDRRIKALSDIVDNFILKTSLVPAEREFHDEALGFLKLLQEVRKEMIEQGNPEDPKVAQERLERYRAKVRNALIKTSD